MKSLLRPLGFKDYPAGNTHFSHLQWRKMKPLRGVLWQNRCLRVPPTYEVGGTLGKHNLEGNLRASSRDTLFLRHALWWFHLCVVTPPPPGQWPGLPASIPALVSGASCSLVQKRLFMLVSHGRSEELAARALVRGPVCVRVSPHS